MIFDTDKLNSSGLFSDKEINHLKQLNEINDFTNFVKDFKICKELNVNNLVFSFMPAFDSYSSDANLLDVESVAAFDDKNIFINNRELYQSIDSYINCFNGFSKDNFPETDDENFNIYIELYSNSNNTFINDLISPEISKKIETYNLSRDLLSKSELKTQKLKL